VPITLIGLVAADKWQQAARFLRQALTAPIESFPWGYSGNINILKLEHLYHLVGDKDMVERVGPVMFPGRWTIFLSYWNRGRMGKCEPDFSWSSRINCRRINGPRISARWSVTCNKPSRVGVLLGTADHRIGQLSQIE